MTNNLQKRLKRTKSISMAILPTLEKLTESELSSDQQSEPLIQRLFRNEFLQVCTSKRTLKSCMSFRLCSIHRLAGRTLHTPDRLWLVWNVTQSVVLPCGKMSPSPFLVFLPLFPSLCHKTSRSTLKLQNCWEALLAVTLLEDFCTFMIKQPLNPLRRCFTTLLFFFSHHFHRFLLGGLPF